MLPRSLTYILALALGSIALGLIGPLARTQLPAQQPAAWQGAYLPVLVSDSAGGDPYALTAPSSGIITAGGPSLFSTASLIAPTGGFSGQESFGPRFWISTEYLLWKADGMDVPPLVTTSPPGTPRDQAAVLGEPGTTILFGGRGVNDDAISGFRLASGFWINPHRTFAIESEFFRLGQQVSRYQNGSDGSIILGRPVFDTLEGRETAQLISYPDLVAGSVYVEAKSNFQSAIINGRAALCPVHGQGCNCGQGNRVDWLVGYRYLELTDGLTTRENLTSLLPDAPGTIKLSDRFNTSNQFNGLQLGVMHRATYHRAWLESMLRVALGGNRQTVGIFGNSEFNENGVTDFVDAGLLTQPSNIGHWRRNEFVMVPEIGMKLGMRLTKCFHSTIGFTALYFPNVVRAGDQVDRDLNPSWLSDDDFVGAPRPRVTFITTDFWAYGLTLGGELRF